MNHALSESRLVTPTNNHSQVQTYAPRIRLSRSRGDRERNICRGSFLWTFLVYTIAWCRMDVETFHVHLFMQDLTYGPLVCHPPFVSPSTVMPVQVCCSGGIILSFDPAMCHLTANSANQWYGSESSVSRLPIHTIETSVFSRIASASVLYIYAPKDYRPSSSRYIPHRLE